MFYYNPHNPRKPDLEWLKKKPIQIDFENLTKEINSILESVEKTRKAENADAKTTTTTTKLSKIYDEQVSEDDGLIEVKVGIPYITKSDIVCYTRGETFVIETTNNGSTDNPFVVYGKHEIELPYVETEFDEVEFYDNVLTITMSNGAKPTNRNIPINFSWRHWIINNI